MRKRLISNIFSLGLIQILNYIVPIISIIYLTKILGLYHYGIFAFTQGIVASGLVLLDFGFYLSATEKISKYRESKVILSKYISAILSIKLILFVVLAVPLLLFTVFTDKYADHKSIFIMSLLPLLTQGLLPSWFFQGVEKTKYLALYTFLEKSIYIISLFVFIKDSNHYYFVPLLIGITQFINLIYCISFLNRFGIVLKVPTKRFLTYCCKLTQPFLISRFAVAIYTNLGTVLLGLVALPEQVAIYAIAEIFYRAMQGLWTPIALATYPLMVKEQNMKLMFQIIAASILVSIIIAMSGYIFIPILFSYFSNAWLQSTPIIDIFLVAIVVHVSTVVTGYPLAAALRRVDVANSSVITGGLVYIIVVLLLYISNEISPANLALLVILSESSVLIHRLIILVPLALKQYKSHHQ